MARVPVSDRPRVMRYFSFAGASTARVEITTNLDTLVINEDIDIQVLYQRNSAGNTGTLMARINGTGTPPIYSFFFSISNANNTLQYRWSPTGATADNVAKNSTANIAPITTSSPVWLRVTHDVDNGASGNDVRFYWGRYDGTLDPPATWTQIGSTVNTAGVTTIAHTPTVGVCIGSFWGGSSSVLNGKIYRALLKNGIDGPTVLDFDATNNTVVSPFLIEGQGRGGVFSGANVSLHKTRTTASGRVGGV